MACNAPSWVVKALAASRKCAAASEHEADRLLQEWLQSLPPQLPPLMDFQKDGIRFGLLHGGRCLLADEMGLGKTLQALAIIAQYRSEWPALVVAPSILRLVWRDQALMWLPHQLSQTQVQVIKHGSQDVDSRAHLVIVSYDLLARHSKFQRRADGLQYKILVADESHYMKNSSAKRTEVVSGLALDAQRCILISGSPALSCADELYTQLRVLLPAHAPTESAYRTRYCIKQTHQFGRRVVVKWAGVQNRHELNSLLTGTIMIRHLKEDVLSQLPPKRRQQITLDTSRLDPEIMSQLPRFMTGCQESESLERPTKDMMDCFHLTAEAKMEAVADYVEYLLGNGIKFLLFGHHHVVLDHVEKRVVQAGAKCVKIDGRTADRQTLVRQFQEDEDTRVAILGITSAGQGLTLTAAHTVVFAELVWLPGQMVQAEDRAHRIGQDCSIDVHYCIAEGTFDPILFKSLNKKSRDTSAMLNGRECHMNAHSKSAAPSSGEKRSMPSPPSEPEQFLTPKRQRKARTQWTDEETEKVRRGYMQLGKNSEQIRLRMNLQHTLEEIETKIKNMSKSGSL